MGEALKDDRYLSDDPLAHLDPILNSLTRTVGEALKAELDDSIARRYRNAGLEVFDFNNTSPTNTTASVVVTTVGHVDWRAQRREASGPPIGDLYTTIVATHSMTTAERFVSPPQPLLDGRWRVVRFTRADAEALVREGIIPEDASTELLDGVIVLKDRAATGEDPTMIGKDHTKCVERLSDLRSRISDRRRHVRSQQPLVCSEIHVPEPDFAIFRGTLDDYDDLPAAADAWCVVEVADASYERDAGEKLAGYARANVEQYIIVNLRNRTAEIYGHPDTSAGSYPPPEIVGEQGNLSLRVGEGDLFIVPLRELLP